MTRLHDDDEIQVHGAELAAAPPIPDVAERVPASGLTARMLIECLGRVKDASNLDKPLRFVLTEGGKPVRESRHWFPLTLIGNLDHRVVFLPSEKDPPLVGGVCDDLLMFVSLDDSLEVVAKSATMEFMLAVAEPTTEVSSPTAASPVLKNSTSAPEGERKR